MRNVTAEFPAQAGTPKKNRAIACLFGLGLVATAAIVTSRPPGPVPVQWEEPTPSDPVARPEELIKEAAREAIKKPRPPIEERCDERRKMACVARYAACCTRAEDYTGDLPSKKIKVQNDCAFEMQRNLKPTDPKRRSCEAICRLADECEQTFSSPIPGLE